jgi:hypothetical protein
MAAEDVLESEEAHYLRRICGRNNARILKMVADEMGLNIPSTVDTCAYDPWEVAVCTTETTINDVQRQKDGRISVLVNCVNSTRIKNGVLCSMHPAEGFWLFKVHGSQEMRAVCSATFFVPCALHIQWMMMMSACAAWVTGNACRVLCTYSG